MNYNYLSPFILVLYFLVLGWFFRRAAKRAAAARTSTQQNNAAQNDPLFAIWDRWNKDRFELLKSVGHTPFPGFINCYKTYSIEIKKDKQGKEKEIRTNYIEVYCKIVEDTSLLLSFLEDPNKAYMRFDSGGAGKCMYYTIGYKIK